MNLEDDKLIERLEYRINVLNIEAVSLLQDKKTMPNNKLHQEIARLSTERVALEQDYGKIISYIDDGRRNSIADNLNEFSKKIEELKQELTLRYV